MHLMQLEARTATRAVWKRPDIVQRASNPNERLLVQGCSIQYLVYSASRDGVLEMAVEPFGEAAEEIILISGGW